MAGSKSLYLENKALDIILGSGGTPWTPPTTVYIALSTAAFTTSATGSSMTEVAGGAYARVAVTNNATNWPAASAGAKANGVIFTFPAATANWGTILSFYIVDASTGGNVLYGADLTTSRTINTGDTASFAVASITLTET